MDLKSLTRISTGTHYKYPCKISKPLLIWFFRKSIKKGALKLQFADEIIEVGSGAPICTIAPPSISRFFLMLLKPDYRLPSYYTKGYWCCEQNKLFDFLKLLIDQENSLFIRWFNLFNRNPIRDHVTYKLFPIIVKRSIANHYNTSPEFMKLILGKHLEYTCAFYDKMDVSLNNAQINKINKVIDRLDINRNDRVLDIGCGWGEIAKSISLKTGANVTGVNLTKNQVDYANSEKIGQTSFILSDYELYHPNERFDKVYSIGMLEHIGHGRIAVFLDHISRLLEPGGKALVHSIVRKTKGSTNSWIDREVFPGGGTFQS